MRINNDKADIATKQLLKPQSGEIRSFTLINLYGDEVVLIAKTPKELVSVLAAQEILDGIIGLEVIVDRLWSGQTCVVNVCELVIIPEVHRISRIDLDYVYPDSSSNLLYVLGGVS